MKQKESFSIGEWMLFLLLIGALVLPRDMAIPVPSPQVNVESSSSPEYGLQDNKSDIEPSEEVKEKMIKQEIKLQEYTPL